MEMYIWNTIILLSKAIFYVGFSAIAGYTFLGHALTEGKLQDVNPNALKKFERRLIVLLPSAFVASLIWFFSSTGAMAEEGIQGALDPDMLDIMWDSSIGDTLLMRMLGLIVAIFSVILPIYLKVVKINRYVQLCALASSLLLLAYSFTYVGHVAERSALEKTLLMSHVLVMSWWFGCLYPLKLACDELSYSKLYELMERFGKQASFLVSILLAAGVVLGIELVGNVEALFSTSYGQTLLLKLLLVVGILVIAAKHKLKLVPLINRNEGRAILSKSIGMEMIFAFAILIVTAGLTSVVGPAN